MSNELIAVTEKGNICYFTINTRTDQGLSGGSFTPLFFDVIRNSAKAKVLEDQPITSYPSMVDMIYGGQFDTNFNQFVAGEQYTLLIKDSEGDPVNYFTRAISILPPLTLGLRTLLDRATYLRNDIENVLFPRLKRTLGFLGENLLVDSWAYDPAGNISGQRLRFFDTKENCELATPGIADDSIPEVGEIATLRVYQENERPRCVRTLHRSAPDNDATDAGVTPNTTNPPVYAQGNEGGWPQ